MRKLRSPCPSPEDRRRRSAKILHIVRGELMRQRRSQGRSCGCPRGAEGMGKPRSQILRLLPRHRLPVKFQDRTFRPRASFHACAPHRRRPAPTPPCANISRRRDMLNAASTWASTSNLARHQGPQHRRLPFKRDLNTAAHASRGTSDAPLTPLGARPAPSHVPGALQSPSRTLRGPEIPQAPRKIKRLYLPSFPYFTYTFSFELPFKYSSKNFSRKEHFICIRIIRNFIYGSTICFR